jgi:hypothetical protein
MVAFNQILSKSNLLLILGFHLLFYHLGKQSGFQIPKLGFIDIMFLKMGLVEVYVNFFMLGLMNLLCNMEHSIWID